MLPDTPENLKQIIGIYKAYAVPMDFYWRDLLYIAEHVFLNPLPFFKYFISRDYLQRPNAYAGANGSPKIWRGEAQAHPELMEFIEKGEAGRKLPELIHHLWHGRVNMEFAEACMRSMFWHKDINPRFNDYLYTDTYKVAAERAMQAYFKRNPVMLGLYKLFPEMMLEKVRELSYYSNLGLFWEVMAPVFFEMSDIYDEGGFASVPDAMDFLVNGIFAVAGRPIYHHAYIDG